MDDEHPGGARDGNQTVNGGGNRAANTGPDADPNSGANGGAEPAANAGPDADAHGDANGGANGGDDPAANAGPNANPQNAVSGGGLLANALAHYYTTPNHLTGGIPPIALQILQLAPPVPTASAATNFWNTPVSSTSEVQNWKEAVVCVICGGVCKPSHDLDYAIHGFNSVVKSVNSLPGWMRLSLVTARPEFPEWQKQEPRATRTYNREGDSMIVELSVTEFMGGYSNIETAGDRKHDLCTSDQIPLLPIHSNCLTVARVFCETQTQFDIEFRFAGGGPPQNLGHLYEIWSKRAIAAFSGGPHTQPIPCPFDYLGVPFHTKLPEYVKQTEKDDQLRRYEQNPLGLRNLTEMIMSRLETIDGNSLEVRKDIKELWKRVQSLPEELYRRVLEHLMPFDADESTIRKNHFTRSSISLECSRILTPLWWRDQLLSGNLIPWIFDLNLKNVQEFRKATFYDDLVDAERHLQEKSHIFDENSWDWELLVRHLAQPDVFENRGRLHGCKVSGLWNRRRIWKLLDNARLGNVVFLQPEALVSWENPYASPDEEA
ncbi:hypothetical protein F5Y18DRAFT_424637 [Xylariaceae sp. FL1019]|nr:hypothetical protein F5Y18DRAFT_424637 [Xylariaceae sp. FL1019]